MTGLDGDLSSVLKLLLFFSKLWDILSTAFYYWGFLVYEVDVLIGFDDSPMMKDEEEDFFKASLGVYENKSIGEFKILKLFIGFTGNPKPKFRVGNGLFDIAIWELGICIDIGTNPVLMPLMGKGYKLLLKNWWGVRVDFCFIVEVNDENC